MRYLSYYLQECGRWIGDARCLLRLVVIAYGSTIGKVDTGKVRNRSKSCGRLSTGDLDGGGSCQALICCPPTAAAA
jgi:hypothetical protein